MSVSACECLALFSKFILYFLQPKTRDFCLSKRVCVIFKVLHFFSVKMVSFLWLMKELVVVIVLIEALFSFVLKQSSFVSSGNNS